jgi:hypothetical protein
MIWKRQTAFVMMSTVLVAASMIAVLLIGQATVQSNEAWSTRAWQMSETLRLTAQSCLELTYRSLLLNPIYNGQSLSLGRNLCIIEVLKEANDYQITVTASDGEYYKKIQAGVSINAGDLTVNNWQEAE